MSQFSLVLRCRACSSKRGLLETRELVHLLRRLLKFVSLLILRHYTPRKVPRLPPIAHWCQTAGNPPAMPSQYFCGSPGGPRVHLKQQPHHLSPHLYELQQGHFQVLDQPAVMWKDRAQQIRLRFDCQTHFGYAYGRKADFSIQ
jgi:hypothetical protein